MIDRLEQALARVIDGGIAAVFRLGIQPADIGRRLERALLDSRRTSMGHLIGANLYVVALHPDDFAAFASWQNALQKELETWLGEIAYRHGVSMLAPAEVEVRPDQTVGRNVVQVKADFGPASSQVGTQPEPVARLIPLSQRGEVIGLSGRETTVGRATGNDVVLDAADVSRAHAVLRRDGKNLELEDLGSRNGTWVNGVRVKRHHVRSGDEIAFGTCRFRLDVR